MTLSHKKRFSYSSLFSFSSLLVPCAAIALCLLSGEAYAIGESDLKEQVTAVDSALKSIANPALWAVIIYIGGMSLIKQNLVGVGIAGAGAVALSQLSGWIQQQFTLTF
jgi:hypothetical protein